MLSNEKIGTECTRKGFGTTLGCGLGRKQKSWVEPTRGGGDDGQGGGNPEDGTTRRVTENDQLRAGATRNGLGSKLKKDPGELKQGVKSESKHTNGTTVQEK